MTKIVLLYFVVLFLVSSVCSEATKLSKPSWTWKCEETTNYKRCVRIMSSETTATQSLKTCNMICSKTPIWPQPTGPNSYFSENVVPIDMKRFALKLLKSPSKQVSRYLKIAFYFMKRDINLTAPMKHDKHSLQHNKSLGLDVRVTVGCDPDPRMRLDTEENYTLEMKRNGNNLIVYIRANSFCGARHGFETLSQLIWYDHALDSVVALELASVADVPKFGYRGLLLDTARQYIPVKDILRTIDAMAASKLNTFHWHATDCQSFPLKLESVPQMAFYGAYSLRQVYTPKDIRTIVHHARVKGIRVVIEIDAPAHVGHSWSWGNSSGVGVLAFRVKNNSGHEICEESPCSQLNPNNDHVYEILEKVYKEIIELTNTDDVFHLGGDEVNQTYWEKNIPGNFMDAWYNFTEKSALALQKANKGKLPKMTIIWSSKLTSGAFLRRLNAYTVQLWGGSDRIFIIPDAGISTVMSHVDAWYLDCGFGNYCQTYIKWQKVYNHRPWANQRYWRVEGGTACMWSELLAPAGVDSKIWPRAAALAERLWSDPPNNATEHEYLRLDMHRQRLVERGIRAESIWSRWCSDNPYECCDDLLIQKMIFKEETT